MDIQVLNEIANPARQASLSQVGAPASANAHLKALKGTSVPALGNPVPPPLENEQTPDPVTPEISSVARAASAYSAAVGDGLNSDELNAIQDLAGRIRTAVSEFLNQPGLEQAENAVTVVATNPEAVQDLTASVEQAVVETLNLPEIGDEVVVNAALPGEDLPEEVPASKNPISIERITNGAEPNKPVQVIAASPVLNHSRASENTNVENPVTVEEVSETPNGDFRVSPASPAIQNANAQIAVVEDPVNSANVPESSRGDFRVSAASPALQNAQAGENAQVETPVSRPETEAASRQESVSRPEAVAINPQEAPVIAASPALQNAQAGENAQVETPVSRPETAAASRQEPASRPEAVAINPQEAPVIAASPALQNAQAGENAQVETPVSRPETAASSRQEPASRPEAVAINPQEAPVIAASPALQNAQAGENAQVETPVSRPEAAGTSQQEPVNRPEAVAINSQKAPVTEATPAIQNAQAQNAEAGNSVNTPVPSVNQGQGLERGQTESGSTNSQPASNSQPGPAPSNGLFTQENAVVNPENIRNVNELVNSVVDNEFTSEAKKIFSEPKVIRTVADLADFILERLREIILTKQHQSQSSGETGLS